MATPLNTIFSWFETGDFPTQAQFQASWSSFWHKDDSIPISQITGLTQVIEQMVSSEALQNHINDSNAHAGYLAKLDASNLTTSHVNNWKEKLGVGEIPANVALVDMGENQSVFNKEQITSICMLLENYVNSNGKIMSGMIEALGLTELIPVDEFTLQDFIANHSVYDFQINDIIAIPSSNPEQGYRLYFYNGGDKTSEDSYLATGLSNVTIAMVQGLQAALDSKMNKPATSGNYYAKHFLGQVSWAAINPASSYLLFWNGNDFIGSGIYTDGTKFGINTVSPTEMLHLNDGRIRSKAIVFDENDETLINQITYRNRKFYGTDSTGAKKQILMVEDLPTEFLKLATLLTPTQKEQFGIDWNNQYSNSAMAVYSITPPIIKYENTVKYIVLQGLNLNVNPAATSVKFIPEGNTLGTGEIDCLGFQTFVDGRSMIVTIYGDSLSDGTNYNIVIRTTAPNIQTHRTTSVITVSSATNNFDLSTIMWQKKIYNDATNSGVFGTAGAGQYQSSSAVKPYANESTIVSALKSSQIINANQDFYLNFDATINFTSPSSTIPTHSIGLMLAGTALELINTNVANVRIVGRSDSHIRQIHLDNSNIFPTTSPSNPDTFNYTIMRRGATVFFLLTKNGVVYNYSKAITTEALSFAMFNSNMSIAATISFNITELLLF